jgi:hypothetical protein
MCPLPGGPTQPDREGGTWPCRPVGTARAVVSLRLEELSSKKAIAGALDRRARAHRDGSLRRPATLRRPQIRPSGPDGVPATPAAPPLRGPGPGRGSSRLRRRARLAGAARRRRCATSSRRSRGSAAGPTGARHPAALGPPRRSSQRPHPGPAAAALGPARPLARVPDASGALHTGKWLGTVSRRLASTEQTTGVRVARVLDAPDSRHTAPHPPARVGSSRGSSRRMRPSCSSSAARGPLTAAELIGETALRRGAALGRKLGIVVRPRSSVPRRRGPIVERVHACSPGVKTGPARRGRPDLCRHAEPRHKEVAPG